MPKIVYHVGEEVKRLQLGWAEFISQYTFMHQEHLLYQAPAKLRQAAEQGLVLLATDEEEGQQVVGCCVLWPLDVADAHGIAWHELGTVLVIEEYRHSRRGLTIADELYQLVMARFTHLNIMATTTSHPAVDLGKRTGLKHVGFGALRAEERAATCVCPKQKTGVEDPILCPIRNRICFVRVTPATWDRMGRPEVLPFPEHGEETAPHRPALVVLS